MPLMGSIYLGTSGLQTSQNALNTTAHNMSNMDTDGYVRQQVLLGDRIYNTIKEGSVHTNSQQVGLGVTYEKVRQVRDYFLDQAYRRESGRSAFYEKSYDAMMEVEDLLDELDDDASFNKSLSNFWSSIEELSKTPDDTVVQRLLVQNAQSFLTSAQQVYEGLVDYQKEVNNQILSKVEEINNLGKQILDLNDKIRAIEVGGIETANDFRDARNLAIDKLAGMVNIEYYENKWGAVCVQVEGMDFVTADTVYEINTWQDTKTGFYTPYWEVAATHTVDAEGKDVLNIDSAHVFDETALISSESNTDVGELRALIYIRGDKVANYTDIPVKPILPERTATMTEAEYTNLVKEYEDAMDVYEQDVNYYNTTIAQSVCMNIQSEFDQLVHNVVTTVNQILADAYDPSTQYMCDASLKDADNPSDYGPPIQLFQKKGTDGYTYNSVTGEWEYMEEITDDDMYSDTLYSAKNLRINPYLIRQAGALGFVAKDGTVDYETAAKLVEAFDSDIYCLNPNVTTKCSINTYYTNLVSQVSNSGSVYKNVSLSQDATVTALYHAREQVHGVSSDEELTSMIKFQNAFNAASRYINVVDEMLEHILTSLG